MSLNFLQRFKVKDKLLGLIVPLFVLALWQGAVSQHLFSELLLVPPLTLLDTLIELFRTGDLISNIQVSLTRVFLGFLLGASAGFILGAGMGLSPIINRALGPLVKVLQQVPELAWMPMIILLFGIDEFARIFFIAIGAFYPMIFNTYQGVSGVPEKYHELARVFDYKSFRYLSKIIIPSALPSIITGIRLSIGLSWMFLVGAELFGTESGVGFLMIMGRQMFQIDVVMAGLVVIGSLGLIINTLLKKFEEYVLRGRVSFDGGAV